MWTPKRIILLSVLFVSFFAVYLGYAYTAVGGIDGLPPLPPFYLPTGGKTLANDESPVPSKSKLVARIRDAFGEDSRELQMPVRLTLPKKNMVLTAGDSIIEDGRVKLWPVSIAMFKERKDQPAVITTLSAEVCFITFDQKIKVVTEIGNRQVTEAELLGDIKMVHKKGGQPGQDLVVEIKKGPLHYFEAKRQIVTDAVVKVTDYRGKSKPHTVQGKGMVMNLLCEVPAGSKGKAKRETISGVKSVELKSGVQMVVQLDGNSGFLSPTTKPEASKDAKTQPKTVRSGQSELTITTPGKFRYDILKEHDIARFEGQEPGVVSAPNPESQVKVARTHEGGTKPDRLECQSLVMQLRRKNDNGAAKESADGVTIDTLHATSTGQGKYVELVSETDGLLVERCNDLYHDTVRHKTTLKSQSEAVEVTYKGESKIQAREIEVQDHKPPPPQGWRSGQPLPPTSRPYQTLRARGPGWVELVEKLDKDEKTESQTKKLRAEWAELLTSEKAGLQDVLTLVGNARFIDEHGKQTLQADTLKVWLDPAPEKSLEVAAKPASTPPPWQAPTTQTKSPTKSDSPSGSRKPRHLEATGNVLAHSADLKIHDTGRLVVRFVDVPEEKFKASGSILGPKADKRPAGTLPTSQPAQSSGVVGVVKGSPAVEAQPASRPVMVGPLLGTPEGQGSEPRPIDLSARYIEAKIERSASKTAIDTMFCEGQVRVRQDPAPKVEGKVTGATQNKTAMEDRGTDVRGVTLSMSAATPVAGAEGGYILKVVGDENTMAELSADRIYICGPEVNIDQAKNQAWVVGEGAMRMESSRGLQGENLAKAVPMVVHWEKSMLFDGLKAEFEGNIQATQENGRLTGQHLIVTFDREVSLKRGGRSDQSPRVKKLVCDQNVRVEDVVRDKAGKNVIKYTALVTPWMNMDALEAENEQDPRNGAAAKQAAKPNANNIVSAMGPGTFRVWESGNSADLEMKTQGKAKPKEPQMKMTLVSFQQKMHANSQLHLVSFWGGVQVLSLPWPRHDKALDLEMQLLDELPAGALYLKCGRLRVLDHPTDGQPNKQMDGYDNVYVQGREFQAYAQSVSYNQQKQQVILRGTPTNPATLIRQKPGTSEKDTLSGEKITYNRAEGKTQVEGGDHIQGSSIPGGPGEKKK